MVEINPLKQPFTTIVAFVASVDQDQAAQNVQPDLLSTLSTLGKRCVTHFMMTKF